MGKKKRRARLEFAAVESCQVDYIPARDARGYGVDRALRLPTVARCLDLLTDTCGQLDMIATVGGRPAPLPEWLRNPENYGSPVDRRTLVTTAVWDMATDGGAYFYATAAGASSWILTPLDPRRVTVSFDDMYRRRWSLDGDTVDLAHGATRRSGLLVAAKNLTNRVARPFGPLTFAPVQAWLDVEDYAEHVFAAGLHSGQTLNTEQDITADTAERYAAAWTRRHTDPTARRIPVLGAGLRLESNIVDPVAAQWLENRVHNAREQARLFGVPAYKLDLPGADGLTYSTAVDADKQFLRTAVAGYLVPLERALSALLPPAPAGGEETSIGFDEAKWLTIYDTAVPADREGVPT